MYGFVNEDDGSHTEIYVENIQHMIYEINLWLNTSNPFIDLHSEKSSYFTGFKSMRSWFKVNDHIFIEPDQDAETIESGLRS